MEAEPRPRRLHLGASRLENLDPAVRNILADPTWVHLGDPTPPPPGPLAGYSLDDLVRTWRRYGPWHVLAKSCRLALGLERRGRGGSADPAALNARTTFLEWRYAKGDRLPFPDASFDFAFSEHFLEHLFFDEAAGVLKEVFRVLRPGGAVRTAVPDSELRVSPPPEPAGYPSPRMPFTDPSKHKTRWSVYLLAETLELIGFRPVPLVYHDRHRAFHRRRPEQARGEYGPGPHDEMVWRFDYLMRPELSLVVDGVRPGE